ncbi:MAG: LysM peptidoglycan-binding domain-containing protein [Gammaproteobacteria bacterium]|nr:LysM peptidoglycan-binding domain-containing protein [Gammaproteobacteria bacterium]
MSIKKLLTTVCAALLTGSLIAADVALNPNHPESYVVVKDDTLWDISGKFLRDPWLWPEVWYVNPQVANPHLIYPGDILNLVYVDGKPRIQRDGSTVRLSPRIREESLDNAIPTIPLDAIQQFLTRAIVVEKGELDDAPYVVQNADEHIVTGAGDRAYVRGIENTDVTLFDIFEPRGPYIDPDTNELLGYEALYAGTGPVQKFGDPATIKLVRTAREVRVGDRLRPADRSTLPAHFQPHAVPSGTEGHIISVLDGVTEIGQFNVVALDLGARDGMEAGHVMRVFQQGDVIKDTVSGKFGDKVKLPDEAAGIVMVFKTFEKVSYGLIMSATRAIHVNDYVRTP